MTGMPARPAVYIRDDEYREKVITMVRHLGWPAPAVYADAGEPGAGRYARGNDWGSTWKRDETQSL